MTTTTGTRIVLPGGMIRWNGVLWRAKGRAPDWLVAHTRVRVRSRRWDDTLAVWLTDYDSRPGLLFVRESAWLPEGF